MPTIGGFQSSLVRPQRPTRLSGKRIRRGLVFAAPLSGHNVDLVSGVSASVSAVNQEPSYRVAPRHGLMRTFNANLWGSQTMTFRHIAAMASPSTAFTLSVWFRRFEDVNGKIFLGQGSDNAEQNSLTIFPDGNIYYEFPSQQSFFAHSDFFLHHLVVAYNGNGSTSDDKLRIVVDGLRKALSFSGGPPATCPSTSDSLTVGTNSQFGQSSKGDISDLWIWNRTLSEPEIRGLYEPRTRWSIYAQSSTFTFFHLGGQFARPDADVADGSWTPSTGTDLFSTVDEATANDTDYMRSGAAPVADTAKLRLSDIDTPDTGDVKINVRHRQVM